jgi:hypothetical protein
MSYSEFRKVMKKEWHPVRLDKKNIPSFLGGVPIDKIHSVYASGTFSPEWESLPNGYPFTSGQHIGGFEVYRNAPDDPFNLNKDGYAVFHFPNDSILVIADLDKEDDPEHWVNEIPDRLKNASG